ncbi:MAG: flagellar basal body and hook protein, partial [Lachnospiraceae bacterium]|nr:flagellar basal body and hook protein [Lachnospiraceae bacterium]
RGYVFADGEIIDRVVLTDFEDYDYLKKYQDTYYRPVAGATEKEAEANIRQGYTEQSNILVVNEMVDLIATTRAYEANQKVIKAADSVMEQAANSVGRVQ